MQISLEESVVTEYMEITQSNYPISSEIGSKLVSNFLVGGLISEHFIFLEIINKTFPTLSLSRVPQMFIIFEYHLLSFLRSSPTYIPSHSPEFKTAAKT